MKKKSKLIRNNKIILFVVIAFIFISLVFISLGIIESQKEVKTTYLNDLIISKNISENINARLDIYYPPIVFASYDTDKNGRFYLVYDNNFWYIAYITTKEYDHISKEKDLSNNPYTIKGVTKVIDKDIKKYAMDEYNKFLNYRNNSKENIEYINKDNFESLLGNVYIDTSKKNTNAYLYFIISCISLTAGAVGILFAFNKPKRKKDKNISRKRKKA